MGALGFSGSGVTSAEIGKFVNMKTFATIGVFLYF